MENGPFIDDFPINTSIYKGFSMAMLNNQMVTIITGFGRDGFGRDEKFIQISRITYSHSNKLCVNIICLVVKKTS
jgi:hypothetical protein